MKRRTRSTSIEGYVTWDYTAQQRVKWVANLKLVHKIDFKRTTLPRQSGGGDFANMSSSLMYLRDSRKGTNDISMEKTNTEPFPLDSNIDSKLFFPVIDPALSSA